MTNAEAIETLRANYPDACYEQLREAVDKAIKALEAQREVTGVNSRQAINLLKGLEQSLDDYCELNDEGKAAFRMAITALELFGNTEQLPSAQTDHTETHSCD